MSSPRVIERLRVGTVRRELIEHPPGVHGLQSWTWRTIDPSTRAVLAMSEAFAFDFVARRAMHDGRNQ